MTQKFFARIWQDCLHENEQIAANFNRNKESEMSEINYFFINKTKKTVYGIHCPAFLPYVPVSVSLSN